VLIFLIHEEEVHFASIARLKAIKSVFGSVVVVTFQIAFHAEIHANDVFLFFKNHF
jgi:hypothetical protein